MITLLGWVFTVRYRTHASGSNETRQQRDRFSVFKSSAVLCMVTIRLRIMRSIIMGNTVHGQRIRAGRVTVVRRVLFLAFFSGITPRHRQGVRARLMMPIVVVVLDCCEIKRAALMPWLRRDRRARTLPFARRSDGLKITASHINTHTKYTLRQATYY